MTVDENIKKALKDRVATLTTSPVLPIAWENKDYSGALPYLRVYLLANRNRRLLLKGSDPHFRQGILQLTVSTALNAGTNTANALAGAVAAHFPADLCLYSEGVKVRVQKAPDIETPLRTATSWDVPVSIPFQAFA